MATGDIHSDIHWMSTQEAAEKLGITVRTLYRLIDHGDLAAYKFGRVIRLQEADVDEFINRSRIAPGSLEHLYPDSKDISDTDVNLR
ncbi:MAG: helix-turn-helix domain-containing protein [Actinobacteria bacterium]|jgi:excisionase family DNA binding protein|nr:MAG: helix-turn-helix domain-containing protein [Actinomycetota bacterium]